MSRPVPTLTPKMLHLAAELLDNAGEEFSNHGCNDYILPDWLTDEDALALDLAEHTWNGDPEEARDEPSRYATDFALMHFLAAVLRAAAGATPEVDVVAVEQRNAKEELRRAEGEAKYAARMRETAEREEAAAAERLKKAREATS